MGLFASLCAFVKRVAVRVPLLGQMGNVPPEARRQALFETLTTTIFATMPFWVLPVLGWFLFSPAPVWDEALRKGEGLIYASVLLGPLVYVITKRYGKFNLRITKKEGFRPLSMSFPYGGAFVTITALTCAISGFAFALKNPSSGAHISEDGAISLSWCLIILSTAIFFLITCYRNMLDEFALESGNRVVEAQPKQEGAFLADWLGAKQ